jgi:hypothetical protein
MRQFIATLLLLAASSAFADEAAHCSAEGGSYLTGVVVKGPKFAHGQFRKGVELSHTHLKVQADQDGQLYDVAIDNVFAAGFTANSKSVPDSLESIREHDRVSLCGQLYTNGVGIHWVHNNCGEKPSAKHPNGWIKTLAADGSTGPNLEDNTQYCSLF